MKVELLSVLCLFILRISSIKQVSHANHQDQYLITKSATRKSDVGEDQITSLLFLVSYDGGRFTGWSAANRLANQTGFVRSVEGVLRKNLSKIFGDVDESRIIIEATSRTDKGVHAKGMVVQAYCLSQDWQTIGALPLIPGKRLPHPQSSFDNTCFVPFRMPPPSLLVVLNRMLPDDVSVLGVSPSPLQQHRPFHPTLDAEKKTYQYRFSFGPIPDPSMWRRTWHVGHVFDASRLDAMCAILRGTHDFRAFRGAPRGKSDRQKQLKESTICSLFDVSLEKDTTPCPILGLHTYQVSVTGDRFLYKMVRFLVGSLVALGLGKIKKEDIVHALETGSFDPRQRPPCAPGNGLLLAAVEFKSDINWLS
jgi:tRNA pseudouridine38-40 synthase